METQDIAYQRIRAELEIDKLRVEIHKFIAETEKAQVEARKLRRDLQLQPLVVLAAFAGGGATFFAAIYKLLH